MEETLGVKNKHGCLPEGIMNIRLAFVILATVLALCGIAMVSRVDARVLDNGESQETGTGNKILGGSNADRSDYRYNVYIRLNDVTICGGSLIAEEWVLTAASCVTGESRLNLYRIKIGDYNSASDGNEFKSKPSSFVIHPDYNASTGGSDIALVQLARPAPIWRSTTALVPKLNTDTNDTNLTDKTCYMTGWGTDETLTTNKRLQVLPVIVLADTPPKTCGLLYEESTMICYYDPIGSACKDDIGNPIMCDINGTEVQVGVNTEGTCAGNTDAQATQVSAFDSWVMSVINPTTTTSTTTTSTTTTSTTTTTVRPPADCGTPPTVDNGVVATNDTIEGSVGQLLCNSNFRPTSPTVCDTSITCQQNGSWSSLPAQCIQVCDSSGTTFIFSYLRNAFAEGKPYLYIVADGPTKVTIQIPFFNVKDTVIDMNKYMALQFSSSLAGNGNEELSNKGINVSTDSPVTVYIHSFRSGDGPSADGTLVLPEACLALNHVVAAYNIGPTNDLLGDMIVTATVNKTTVTIKGASVDKTVSLNRLQTYHLRGADFTGTVVTSTNPVAVMAGHECGSVPDQTATNCDHLIEHIPPVNALGALYIVPAMAPRPNYLLRIVASVDGTSGSIFDASATLISSFSLNAGQTFERAFTSSTAISIASTIPILVAQYGQGASTDTLSTGDPSFVIYPALNQFKSSYRLYTPNPPDLYSVNYAVIIESACYSAGVLMMDGTPISDVETPITVPGYGDYTITYVDVSTSGNNISHTDPEATFGVIQYGANSLVEYAWVAGRVFANVADVSRPLR